jgi:hypothetical protein
VEQSAKEGGWVPKAYCSKGRFAIFCAENRFIMEWKEFGGGKGLKKVSKDFLVMNI